MRENGDEPTTAPANDPHSPCRKSALRGVRWRAPLLFHPAELYSVYGLLIQRDSPLPHTLVVGYADGYIGYVPDPKAYVRNEYAAAMRPTILNYPPFTPNAGRELTAAAVELLRKIGR